MSRNVLLAALVIGLAVSGAGAQTAFTFVLDGAQASTPATSLGVGFATLDASNNLTVTIQHNVANITVAHIHSAPAGMSGGIVFPFTVSLTSPFTETFALTVGEAATLLGGNYYVNLHSSMFPAGEIRGQIVNSMQQQVFVNEYLANPGGFDSNNDGNTNNVDDEFIEIVNATDANVVLDGWTIADGFSTRHTFPAGTSLDPGAAIIIFGGGDDTSFVGASQLASGGSLGLNNGSDTITLSDSFATVIDVVSYTATTAGTSTVRDTETTSGTFVDHNTLPSAVAASPALYNDGIFLYPFGTIVPLAPAYLGNGTDADMVVRKNGVVDEPITNVHTVAPADFLSVQYRSPGGTLSTAPFLSLAQVLTTGAITGGILLPGDTMGPLIIDLTPGIVSQILFDSLSNPGGLFTPVLDFTQLNFFVPAFLFGNGNSIIITCIPADASVGNGQFGNAEAHEFILP